MLGNMTHDSNQKSMECALSNISKRGKMWLAAGDDGYTAWLDQVILDW
jgi:hypothetical protein